MAHITVPKQMPTTQLLFTWNSILLSCMLTEQCAAASLFFPSMEYAHLVSAQHCQGPNNTHVSERTPQLERLLLRIDC